MNFLNPTAFFLSILLPIIILMYLLRLQRPQQIVSSTFLWQKLVRDVEANAPWQKLQRNILMILQLLFLTALILALTNPFFWTKGSGGNSMIIIIDNSASMAATDVAPSRIEAAKQQAQKLVDAAPENTRITVISGGENTEILVSASQDRKQTQHAINSINFPSGNSDLSVALQISAAITIRQQDTDVIILSDGKVDLPERVSIRGNLLFYPIGLAGDNQGITNIQLKQNSSGDNNTLYVQVKNFNSEAILRRLEIYNDHKIIDAVDLEIDPYSQKSYIREGLPIDSGVLEARLSDQDFLPQDDVAWVVSGSSEPVEIVLVTERNRFLETALSLLPNIKFSSITITNFEELENIEADLVVFDGSVPSGGNWPRSNILFISPPSSTPWFEVTNIVDQPQPRPVEFNDPIIKNISFEDVSVLSAVSIPLPAWANLSLAGDYLGNSIPLLFYGTNAGQRIAVLTFKLQNSDLPIQVAFPLLVANLVNWLVPNQSPQTLGENARDMSRTISIPLDVNAISIIDPNGNRTQKVPEQAGMVILDTNQPGIYTLEWDDNQIITAVNFFSDKESDIFPQSSLDLPGIENSTDINAQQQSRKLIWRPIAFISLVFLIAEWIIYNRGALAKFAAATFKREA